ncbi:PPOX class F420-dependent oxidoreductase [Amycolatopsis suaedae]|uniref:PPOX class F420-dependent oxidoreductase n=1 Tax=Amycolatopsis suaedae TaxID=2510978 RepID=A0A4Q7J0U5_9PSEU|nr:PPOX class F420-dependent oxidoreductase [Amycolatopsis suaedae]RZQ60016.1 PPOX class F420-dependent oxidoreductase [Amycolatopsis suaedae]
MASELDRLGAQRYVVLTTFRKDGTPVPTPLWAAADDTDLLVWTPRDSGKVKRIRRDGRVEVQASDFSGKKPEGPVVTGQARLLDDEASDRVRSLIARKYGITGRLVMFGSRLRGGRKRTLGIAVRLDEST